MKLIITTGEINITYEDEYSTLQEDVKKRIIDIIQSLPTHVHPYPTGIVNLPNQPFVGTCEEFFNKK